MKRKNDTNVLIEFGSNTAKVYSCSALKSTDACFYRLPLRLASQLNSSQMLSEKGIKSILDTIADVKQRFTNNDQIRLIGTEALRRAKNSAAVQQRIAEQFGLNLRILSWQEEAEAAYRGVLGTAGASGRIICFDIGGSSTEIIQGKDKKIERSKSFPVGAVDLSRKFIRKQPLTQCMYTALNMELERKLVWKNNLQLKLLGSGGAVYTCAMVALMHAGKSESEALKEIDGSTLRRSEIIRQEQSYRALTLEQISQIPGMDPSRVDIILPAVMIIRRIMENTREYSFIVSTRGVWQGIMFANR